MTLSHNSSRLYSDPDYKRGGFTPFKFQAGMGTLGDDLSTVQTQQYQLLEDTAIGPSVYSNTQMQGAPLVFGSSGISQLINQSGVAILLGLGAFLLFMKRGR